MTGVGTMNHRGQPAILAEMPDFRTQAGENRALSPSKGRGQNKPEAGLFPIREIFLPEADPTATMRRFTNAGLEAEPCSQSTDPGSSPGVFSRLPAADSSRARSASARPC